MSEHRAAGEQGGLFEVPAPAASAPGGSTSSDSAAAGDSCSPPVAPKLRTTAGFDVVDTDPVARVRLIGVLPHLDRPFEYAVTPETSHAAAGMRVRVKFAGRDTDGIVLARRAAPETDRPLAALTRVVSDDIVVPPVMMRVCEQVADRCGGTVGDVLRLALPPRHARAEKADRAAEQKVAEKRAAETKPAAEEGGEAPATERQRPGDRYRGLSALVARAGSGQGPVPRAAIILDPVDAWTDVAADAVAELGSERGALVIAPDLRDVERVSRALDQRGIAHAILSSSDGPERRYRTFRRILRGDVSVVLGNRSAAFAPIRNLALAICWDEADDLLIEPRAPYPHMRTILQCRSAEEQCALLFLAASESAPVRALAESGYLHVLEPEPLGITAVRPHIVAMDEYLREREGPSGRSRIPSQALRVIRAGLERGPVLVQVPRRGYVPSVACTFCGTRAVCPTCSAPLGIDERTGALHCGVCGRREDGYRCSECHRTHVRAVVVGSGRTAAELARALPDAELRVAGGAHGPLPDADVPDHGLVIATPGAEPVPDGRYAAAVLLDADGMLTRASFDADVEAVRRWRNAIALVHPADDGGEVLIVGTATLPAIRDLVAHRSRAFLDRVLEDRRMLDLPPFTRVAEVVGDSDAVAAFLTDATLPVDATVFGPTPLEGPDADGRSRAVLRVPIRSSRVLAEDLRAAVASRSARKAPGTLRMRMDPPGVF